MRLASVMSGFILSMVLARGLGSVRYGGYAALFALMQALIIIGNGGLIHQMVRDVATSIGSGREGVARAFLRMGWFIALPSAIVMAGLFAFVLAPHVSGAQYFSRGVALYGGGYVGAMILVGMLEAGTRGCGRVLLGQLSELFLRPTAQLVFTMVFMTGVLGVQFGVKQAVAAAMCAALLALLVALMNYRRSTSSLQPVARAQVKSGYTRDLISLSATIWIAAVNTHLNILVLGFLGDEEGAGLFQVAVQLTTMVGLGLMACGASMAPQISQLSAKVRDYDRTKVQDVVSRACGLSLAFGAPLSVIYILFGNSLITYIFGPSFEGAYSPTLILTVAQFFNISFGPVAIVLYAYNLESIVLKGVMAGATCNLCLCLMLIPDHGAVGAAIASASSVLIWNSICFVGLARSERILSLPLVSNFKLYWRGAR